MVDFTQFFNPSAFGAWNPPNQSMLGSSAQPSGTPNTPPPMRPGIMPAMNPLGGAGANPAPGGGNPLSMLFGGMGGGAGGGMFGGIMDKFNASPMGQKIESAFDQWQKNRGGGPGAPMNITPNAQPGGGGMMGGISGNPLLAKFGAAMMQGQNPLQAMAQNPGDFAKWMAQRRQQQGNPSGPQPPVPTQNPGMLGGLY